MVFLLSAEDTKSWHV